MKVQVIFTQEQIDKIVERAQHVAFHPVDENDIEVDPISIEEQGTSLSENDEGGVWVRAWVYVRLEEVFGPTCEKCGHQCVPEGEACEKCGEDPMEAGTDTLCSACNAEADERLTEQAGREAEDKWGPSCGHSACRQNWIDNGKGACIEGEV